MAITMAKIGQSIVKGAKAFSGRPLGITSKALGIATAASVLYDAHINGRERAFTSDEVISGERQMNLHRQYMTSSSNSATISRLKRDWYMGMQASSCCHLWTKAKGYVTGAAETIVNNIPKIALSAVSLISLKNKGKTAGTAGKIAGCLLAADWLKTVAVDVLGLGAKSPDRHY